MTTLHRPLDISVRVVDSQKGMVDYIASTEAVDSYREIIRVNGWRFNLFRRNSPFLDSHDSGSIRSLLGRVVEFGVKGGQLIERVQWAIDVADNTLAQLGWKMTEAGYLKAVSVGFWPVRFTYPGKADWQAQLDELKLPADSPVRLIYQEQEQVELSACVLGANPDALAKAYKAGVLAEEDLENFSKEYIARHTASGTAHPAHVTEARERERREFLERLNQLTSL